MRRAILGIILLAIMMATGMAAAQRPAATGGASTPTADQVRQWIESYKGAHPGNNGKDWDINAKTPAEIAADPAAQRLMDVCGKNQRPVIPLMAWEYGGADHKWINPQGSALVYCVHTPIKGGSSPNWHYDGAKELITADVFVRFPEQNPCRNQQGAKQVSACIGDETNFEILVDTASINDGIDVGLSLANASTKLRLVLPDGSKVDLWFDQ